MIYHVSIFGSDKLPGTEAQPFRTINHAAALALPGDTVLVHSGTYREQVDPQVGGLSDTLRVTYAAAPGEHPVIKGSEILVDWEPLEGTVWKKTIPNSFFGDWNPFAIPVDGDWLIEPNPPAPMVHLGDVYLNGKSMYEAASLEAVKKAEKRVSGCQVPSQKKPELIPCPEDTVYQWYAEVEDSHTTLYVNFQQADPNRELVEINVRKTCFYPSRTGINYITLRGFEIAQAACPFAPPTADQPGMVGPHWSKGWIIEDCDLHDAKCSALSLGKEISTGHNLYSRFGRKPGYQYQMEAVFLALRDGWSREKIGSHLVRNNRIHDCGQNGIVGHMGCIFSRIEHNEIWNIAVKHEFFGYEIAGIKFHAAIDTVLENNNIHDCTLGVWLDWEAQGTRVTRNVFWRNGRDLMLEVTHGPCMVDNNIFASPDSMENAAEGSALVHNLYCGAFLRWPELNRATPYHFQHSTQAAGFTVVYGGDDRVLNNLWLPQPGADENPGTAVYDNQSTPEEDPERLRAEGNVDDRKFRTVPQPVWIGGNVYSEGAAAFRGEKDALLLPQAVPVRLTEAEGKVLLTLEAPQAMTEKRVSLVTTACLGMPRTVEQPYEQADGSPYVLDTDLLGQQRGGEILPGPFARLQPGNNSMTVWSW